MTVKMKELDPRKKPVVSAIGVAFRVQQPENIKQTGKEGIWTYEPRS